MAGSADNSLGDNEPSQGSIEAEATAWFARRDAGLNVADETAYQQWIQSCPHHAAAMSRLEAAWTTFGKPTQTGAADKLLNELATRRIRRRRRRFGAATAMLAVVAFGFGVVDWQKRISPVAMSSAAVLLKPNQRVLADGSTITLRDGADVFVGYSSTKRLVTLLKGEALFEVTKDQERPFIVSANGVEVRAVGTAFTVQFGSRTVDVLVTEGTVSIAGTPQSGAFAPNGSTAAEPPTTEALTVSAGNRVVVTASVVPKPVEREAVPSIEIDQRLSWRAPRVEFSGMPLADAVALLNREALGRTTTKLHIADRELEPMRVSGIFRTDNMDAFVLLLEAGFGVKAERVGDTIVLNRVPHSK